ncbi:MAG TPA: tyrosine-type recombinase/integrase, partial [Nitrosopumilaceae archaeon]|nr:tyrosine-type recombinase/integrase [Nitrosopumilaceae archaeon]
MEPRCIKILRNATKTEATFKTYMYNLRKFLRFCKLENYEDLLSQDPAKIHRLIEDWIMDLKETKSPNSIPTMYYGIELFFSMNDITLNYKKLRRMFPSKVKRTGDKPYTTDDIEKMLSVSRYKRDKAFILFLASTGSRVGVIEDLKLKHIEDMKNGCKSVLMYEGSKEEYFGFLTPEASKAMDEYLDERKDDGEKLNPESPVFRTTYSDGIIKPKSLTVAGSKNIIYRVLHHARIKRNKIGNAYDVQLDMGFRKRFNTILKLNNDVNSNVAEKLMGHKRGLDGA